MVVRAEQHAMLCSECMMLPLSRVPVSRALCLVSSQQLILTLAPMAPIHSETGYTTEIPHRVQCLTASQGSISQLASDYLSLSGHFNQFSLLIIVSDNKVQVVLSSGSSTNWILDNCYQPRVDTCQWKQFDKSQSQFEIISSDHERVRVSVDAYPYLCSCCQPVQSCIQMWQPDILIFRSWHKCWQFTDFNSSLNVKVMIS